MEDTPIAIVGMSCRFAQAQDIRAFWRNVVCRRSAFAPLDHGTALPIGFRKMFDTGYPSVGAQLGNLYSCRPFEQSFPRQMNAGENHDLYFITQLAFDALSDAAMRSRSQEARRGTVRLAYAPVFNPALVNWLCHTYFIDQTVETLRRCFPGATEEHMDNIRGKLKDSLPSPDADSLLSATGNRIADWIAREISFTGGAASIDGGTLSGISVLESAMDDLQSGRADVAIAGAVFPPLNRPLLEGLSGRIQFTEERELYPFDRDAHGTIPGEGGAFFVLKRRADALAAHDRIYALVRSTATGVGRPPIGECIETSKAPLSTIAMIEADGSGMPDMDNADIDAIRELWGEHRPGGALVGVGSVKGNVGHCFTAAAAASILKVAQSLYMRVLAPQVAVPHPIERLSNIGSSAYLLDKARPWITGNPALPRRAVVCADDFDGRRMAVLMEEEPENRR